MDRKQLPLIGSRPSTAFLYIAKTLSTAEQRITKPTASIHSAAAFTTAFPPPPSAAPTANTASKAQPARSYMAK